MTEPLVRENSGLSPLPPPRRPSYAITRFWPLWCGAVLVPALLLALAGWASWTATEEAERGRMVQVVQMLREQALRTVGTQQALLAAVQARIAGMDWRTIASSDDVARFLHDLGNGMPPMQAIGIVGPDGTLLRDSRSGIPPDASWPDQGAWPPHPGGPAPVVRRVAVRADGADTDNATIVVSIPRQVDGHPDGGLLWASLPAATFEAVYREAVENPDDRVALLQADGPMVVTYPPDLRPPPLVGGSTQTVRLWSGPRFLQGAAPVSGLPLTITYAVGWDHVRAEWRESFGIMALITVAAMALLLALTWRASTHARREEAALRRVAHEAERRAEMETVFRRGQRLETLGRVVAGVAHDFRNVVQALIGGAELAQQAIDRGEVSRARVVLKLIGDSAQRADQLTQRMLRMAQDTPRTDTAPPCLALGPAIESAVELVRRTLGGGHAVRLEIANEGVPAMVRGDEAEFQATLLNLGLNAVQAMPEGGEMTITVSAQHVEEDGAANPDGLPPGHYARIQVRDTGIGMDRATLARVGEAFFTTRSGTGGTGLGVAMARAFTEDAGGAMRIWSAGPGRGCTVTLWLAEA